MARIGLSLVLMLLAWPLQAGEAIALFNGKDLTGWTFDVIDSETKAETIWSVSEGLLICQGRPPSVMRSTREDFSNYELTIEWRWAPGKKPGNSGVLIHSSKPRQMFVWPQSIEVQLRDGDAGDFWTIGETLSVANSTPQGRRWPKRQKSSENPPGEWNTMRIRCEADKVSVWVNAALMNEATQLSARKGAICLQSEGAEIHFRKVELKPIE